MIQQPRVRVGDTLESAIWLDGTEKPEQVAMHKLNVQQTLEQANEASGAVTGPIRWSEKKPGDERVPEVPDHIQGDDVRLLVAECDVLNVRPSESKFLAELEPGDLRRLRKITRDAHKTWWRKTFPRHAWPRPSDRQCDTLINDLGPDVAYEALQKGWTRLAGDEAETLH